MFSDEIQENKYTFAGNFGWKCLTKPNNLCIVNDGEVSFFVRTCSFPKYSLLISGSYRKLLSKMKPSQDGQLFIKLCKLSTEQKNAMRYSLASSLHRKTYYYHEQKRIYKSFENGEDNGL